MDPHFKSAHLNRYKRYKNIAMKTNKRVISGKTNVNNLNKHLFRSYCGKSRTYNIKTVNDSIDLKDKAVSNFQIDNLATNNL